MRAKQLIRKYFKNGKEVFVYDNNYFPKKKILVKIMTDSYLEKGKFFSTVTNKFLVDVYEDTFNYSECGKAIKVFAL